MRTLLLKTTLLAISPLVTSRICMAAQQGPTSTVQIAFSALEQHDWPTLATLVHPDALATLRQHSLAQIIVLAELAKAGKPTANFGYNPGDIVIADHLPQVGDQRVPEFPTSPSINELAALSPADFFVRWCQAVYESRPELPGSSVPHTKRHIIGEVMEGDTLAHVVYRREGRWMIPWHVDIMPLRRLGDRWSLLLNDDIGESVDLMTLFHDR